MRGRKQIIDSGANVTLLPLVGRACPVCGRQNDQSIYRNDAYLESAGREIFHSPISYKLCSNFRMIYMDPALCSAANEYIYAKLMIFPFSENPASSPVIINKFNNLSKIFERHIGAIAKSQQTVLEIGCGTGEVLALFTKRYGGRIKQAIGIEPSRKLSRQSAARFNNEQVKILNCSVEKYAPVGKFDLIIMDNVYEHLNGPVEIFQKITGWLHPKGAIYLALPDILKPTACTLRDIYSAHPQTYSTYTIEKIAGRFGFNIEYFFSTAWHNHFLITRRDQTIKLNHPSAKSIQLAVNAAIVDHDRLIEAVRSRLQSRLDQLQRCGKKLLVFGAGDHTISLLSLLNFYQIIVGLIDRNDTYWRQKRFGYTVLPPAELTEMRYDFILISSYTFENEIFNYCVHDLSIPEEKIIKIYS
jgi:SAM-dependent methyltransferase